MNLDTMLTAHYNAAADEPMPGGGLDLDRAIAGGKRLIAGRRIRRASLGTAAIALAALVGVSAVGIGTDAPNTGATSGQGLPHADNSGPAATLTGSDPFIMPLSFGWLPSGYIADAAGFSVGQFQTQADNGVVGDEFGLSYLTVGAGQSPPLAITLPGEPAPPARLGQLPATIEGHQAHWMYELLPDNVHSTATNESLSLSWQIHGSQWAEIDYNDTKPLLPDDIVATFLHIADTVVVHGTQFPLPFHLPAAPSSTLPVADVGYEALNRDQSAWTISLYFGGLSCAYTGGSDCLLLSVVGNGGNRLADAAPTPSAGGRSISVPGGTAVVFTKAGTSMIVATVNGLQIAIVAIGQGNTFVQEHGGILAYFNSITWLGTASSGWTTHVIG